MPLDWVTLPKNNEPGPDGGPQLYWGVRHPDNGLDILSDMKASEPKPNYDGEDLLAERVKAGEAPELAGQEATPAPGPDDEE